METLNFDEIYENAIKEGIKTSTIRAHCNLKVGDRVRARTKGRERPNKKFGEIIIVGIKRIRFDEIDKEIARTEGYLHEDIAKTMLKQYYMLEDSSLLYYVTFEYMGESVE